MDSEGARDLASSPGGRPPRLRPSSASGDGAGDGARGGGGQTGANVGDLGGVGAGENGGDWAGYDADSDRGGGGGPSAPESMLKVPGTTSRGSSSDGAASAGVSQGCPPRSANAGPKLITKLYTCFEAPRGRLGGITQAPDHEIAHAHDLPGGSSWFRK